MRKLNLADLYSNRTGLSEKYGGFLAEGAVVGLEHFGHQSGIKISCSGDVTGNFKLDWIIVITPEVLRSWRDMQEVTEYGATAIAILLIKSVLKFTSIRRNIGAADYILDNVVFPNSEKVFQMVYVEISGILKETKKNTVATRTGRKRVQVRRISKNAPYVVVVVEFSTPKSKIKYQI